MIITVAGLKGGTCKSLIASHLAVYMHEADMSIAVIDCDPQHSTYNWIARAEPKLKAHGVNPRASDIKGEILDAIATLSKTHENIIIDCPSVVVETNRAAISVADNVIIPSGASMEDFRLMMQTIKIAKQESERRRGDPMNAMVVLTRVMKRSKSYQEAISDARKYRIPITEESIAFRIPYQDSVGQGSVVWRMGPASKDAAVEIRSVLKEIITNGGDAEDWISGCTEPSGTGGTPQLPITPGTEAGGGEGSSPAGDTGAAAA